MWNLHSFFSTKDPLAVHCDTEEKAHLLCEAFHLYGKAWINGAFYIDNFKYFSGTDTCYTNAGTYGKTKLMSHEWTIIPFEDIYLKVILPETINRYKAAIDIAPRVISFSKSPKIYSMYPRILLGVTRDALNCEETLFIDVYQDFSTHKCHIFLYNIETFTAVLYDIHSRGYLLG